MEANTSSNRMISLVVLYDMQTTFFRNALEGISDEDAHNRLNTKANHIAWLTGSLVNERYEMAGAAGADMSRVAARQADPKLFENYQGIQDGATYPSLDLFRKDWDSITPVLRDAYLKITDEQLDKPFEMPGTPMSFYDMISFMIYREANCIGQIALWRRLLGYEPMKYM